MVYRGLDFDSKINARFEKLAWRETHLLIYFPCTSFIVRLEGQSNAV